MNKFSTYVYKENETLTSNQKVMRARPYYITIIFIMVAILFAVAGFDPGAFVFGLLAFFVGFYAKFISVGPKPSVGHRPKTLTLLPDAILIGEERIEIKAKSDIRIRIVGYKGESITFRPPTHESHNGNENVLTLRYKNTEAKMNFVLESAEHKDELLKFCDEHGIKVRGKWYWF